MFRLLLILHNLSSRPMNLVGNGFVWRCWHDMQLAEETATVKSSSSVVCRQHDLMMLKWWRQQTSTFPKLAALERSVLAVPATSVPPERVFSVAGLVINAKRSSLAPSRANKIIFVHENDRFVAALKDD